MNKKIMIGFLLFPLIALGSPAIGGGRGLFRVQDVKSEGRGMLSISVHSHILKDSLDWYGAPLSLGFPTYAPLDWIEFFVNPNYGLWSRSLENIDTTKYGFYDTKAGIKLSFVGLPIFKIGCEGLVSFPTTEDAFNPPPDRKVSFGGAILAAIDFGDILRKAPFNLLLNLGTFEESILFGLGLILPGENYAVGVETFYHQDTLHFTPGAKFSFPFKVGLDVGLDITPGRDPLFKGILGVNFITPFLRPVPPAFGTIAGSVRDAVNGRPLMARVVLPDQEIPPFNTDKESGIFRLDSVPIGVVSVEVSKKGYITQSVPLVIKKDETTTYDFLLQPTQLFGILSGIVRDAKTSHPLRAKVSLPGLNVTPKSTDPTTGFFKFDSIPVGAVAVEVGSEGYLGSATSATIKANEVTRLEFDLKPALVKGTVIGQVTDRKTHDPLGASITFPNTSIPAVHTDPSTGIYKAELPVGSYAALAKSEGYIDQPAPIVIEEGKTTEKNFELVKKGMVITLRGIQFDFDKATLRPESYSVLDDAARILKENPTIKVEIQGHTCSMGTDAYNLKLSQARAASVVNYFLSTHHIDPRRLISIGYGESRPIASNDNEAGRELNRRVEFVILGEM